MIIVKHNNNHNNIAPPEPAACSPLEGAASTLQAPAGRYCYDYYYV